MVIDRALNESTSSVNPAVATNIRPQFLTWHRNIMPSLSIIVPTLNEQDNIDALLSQIKQALDSRGEPFEVIFVDDSKDDTPHVIRRASKLFPCEMALIERPAAEQTGLGTAVVEGMRVARADWICVMDGDLQHPPEVIPQLIDKANTTGVDLIAGSRLAKGGGVDGLSNFRKVVSHGLAITSKVLFPERLNNISDPLTGFFLFRRKLVDPERLHPEGFKILLEILVRCPQLTVSEVPFKFGERHGGESKASTQQVIYLFRHYIKLMVALNLDLIRFLIVGASGILVNSAALAFFAEFFGIFYLSAAVLATQVSTFSNFSGTEWWVFRNRAGELDGSRGQRLFSYFAMNNTLLLLRAPFLAVLVSMLGVNYLVANFFTLIFFTLLRFGFSDRVIWKGKKDAKAESGKVSEVFNYNYNIHDIIKIRSVQRLPELGYFQTADALDDVDFEVRIVRNIADYKQANSICYDELFGKHGFSIVINRNDPFTEVFASPTISRSPHVLYTNVMEPLLRWHFVKKGYTLMHGACLSFSGQAVFITAQTDTGKTTTILHTIRKSNEVPQFLSDDMTIFCPDGTVLSYPKPLTISQHTVHAIGGAPLSWKERAFLKIQSRLHSRGGRRFGMLLSDNKMPAATLNSIVQTIVPPPKYMVDKLVPKAEYIDKAVLSQIVLIERGEPYQGEIPKGKCTDILLDNADDAYGFPPYPVLEDQLSSWQGKSMHETERGLVENIVKPLPATHLRSNTYDWFEHIPHLLNGKGVNSRQQINPLGGYKIGDSVPEAEATSFPIPAESPNQRSKGV